MKTLIIHPADSTTTFLKPIYAPIRNKTVVTGGIDKSELRELIYNHDRVIMLGHGTPWGLMAVNQFPGADSYIIDHSFSDILSTKMGTIYIWCYADEYVLRNNLEGFYSGMFISEVAEARTFGFWDVEQNTIDESNHGFASIVSKFISHPMEDLFKNVLLQYGNITKTNPIAGFNLDRLYYKVLQEKFPFEMKFNISRTFIGPIREKEEL